MTGLYIHIPFCQRKCLYCDFPSYEGLYHLENGYVDALLAEMQHFRGTSVDTVYLGGGTPSSLSERSLAKILNGVHTLFRIAKNCEITAEVNPASAIESKLLALKNGGVNRLSVGIQSLQDRELVALGRLHNKNEALKTLSLARAIGFSNISVDLMLAIPYQSVATLNDTFDHILSFHPEHVSACSLIVEPGTPFDSMELPLPNEADERMLYWHAVERLKNAGYHMYELSNFAVPGKESKHNRKYWSGEHYIGIGAGAHSYFSMVRYSHTKDIENYIHSPVLRENIVYISPKEHLKEYFILGLRNTNGVEYHGEFPNIVQKHLKNGLLEEADSHLRLTKRGIDLANQVWMDFI